MLSWGSYYWPPLFTPSFTRGIWCRRRGSTVPTSGYANKQRTFNHFSSHALCLKGFWVWRSIGSIASAWNLLLQRFSVWWKLIGLHCCFHLQPTAFERSLWTFDVKWQRSRTFGSHLQLKSCIMLDIRPAISSLEGKGEMPLSDCWSSQISTGAQASNSPA